MAIHDDPQVRKKPGTAELLAWLDVLITREGLTSADALGRLKALPERLKAIERTLCALVKSRDDLEIGRRALRQAPVTA